MFARLITELGRGRPPPRRVPLHRGQGPHRSRGGAAARACSGSTASSILDDYELTNVTRSDHAHRRASPRTRRGRHRRRAWCGRTCRRRAPRWTPRSTGSTTSYGGAEGFLLASGVSPETLDALRDRPADRRRRVTRRSLRRAGCNADRGDRGRESPTSTWRRNSPAGHRRRRGRAGRRARRTPRRRDQGADLSPGAQTELTHHFGAPCETPFVGTLPDYPEVIKVLKEADEARRSTSAAPGTPTSRSSSARRATRCCTPSTCRRRRRHRVDANIAALDQLPATLRGPIDKPDVNGVHTAKDAYSPKMQPMHDGLKHMDIRTTEDANDVRTHPIITTHPGNKQAGAVLQPGVRAATIERHRRRADDDMQASCVALHRHCDRPHASPCATAGATATSRSGTTAPRSTSRSTTTAASVANCIARPSRATCLALIGALQSAFSTAGELSMRMRVARGFHRDCAAGWRRCGAPRRRESRRGLHRHALRARQHAAGV